MSKRAWLWYLRFVFVGGGTFAFLGIFELVFSPDMMAVDTQEGLVDTFVGAMVLLAGLIVYTLKHPEMAIKELQKIAERQKKGVK